MVAERPGFSGRPGGQDMSVEGGKQRALIDQIVAGIADQSDAVEDHPSGEFGGNDDSIQSQGKMQPRLEIGIGGVSAHASSVARVKAKRQASRRSMHQSRTL